MRGVEALGYLEHKDDCMLLASDLVTSLNERRTGRMSDIAATGSHQWSRACLFCTSQLLFDLVGSTLSATTYHIVWER
jgi:hypothetical protein